MTAYVGRKLRVPPNTYEKWNNWSTEESYLSAENEFSVMTYNILAPIFTTGKFATTCPGDTLSQAYRTKLFFQEIDTYTPDVCCMQEVENFPLFEAEFAKKGYEGWYLSKCEGDATGTATFWKSNKFSLLGKREVDFNEIDKLYPNPTKRYATGHTAQITLLQTNSQAELKCLCVGNTHQFWDPNFADVKTLQAFYLFNRLNEYIESDSIKQLNPAIIITGDFNSLPDSDVYTLFSRGFVKNPTPTPIIPFTQAKLPFPLVSSYQQLGEPLTNFTSFFKGCLDYIWFRKTQLKLIKVLEPLDPKCEVFDTFPALPNPFLPSDHVCLMAVFTANQ